MWRSTIAMGLLAIGAAVGCTQAAIEATPVPDTPTKAPLSDSPTAELMAPRTPVSEDPVLAAANIPARSVQQVEIAGTCQLIAGGEAGAPVYAAPSSGDTALGMMQPGSRINAEARTATVDGRLWYRVPVGEADGWLESATVMTAGPCSELPLVTTNVVTTGQLVEINGVGGPLPADYQPAPYDADTYDVVVNASTGAAFSQQISYPDGDHIDRVWLRVDAPNGDRQYTIRVTCEGSGAEALRWGSPESPSLRCNDATTTTFNADLTQRQLLVMMPDGSPAGSVAYNVAVSAYAAPDAEAFLFALQKDRGGRVAQAISYPEGDTSDIYVLRVEDFGEAPTERQRDFEVFMRCTGDNADALRWGDANNPRFRCQQTAYFSLSTAQAQQQIVVVLPEGSAPGYLDYVLVARAVAPIDSETYLFTADRNSGGQFGESVSSPSGDSTDAILFAASNLIDAPPHNFREFELTLLCSGDGVEQVRWGSPTDARLGCGGTTVVPMLAGTEGQAILVTVPEGRAFVNYTLVARPRQPE